MVLLPKVAPLAVLALTVSGNFRAGAPAPGAAPDRSAASIAAQLRGVPFRATQVIVRKGPTGEVETRGRIARNSAGSTYIELVDEVTGKPAEVLIFDVPHRQELILDVAHRRYRVLAAPGLEGRELPLDAAAEQLRVATLERNSSSHEVENGMEKTWRHLGVRRLGGLEAVGSVETRRPLAGAGETTDGPAEIDESWVSVDLGIAVLRRQHDPISGEDTEVTLTAILRAEPDTELFEVPAGYRLETGIARSARH